MRSRMRSFAGNPDPESIARDGADKGRPDGPAHTKKDHRSAVVGRVALHRRATTPPRPVCLWTASPPSRERAWTPCARPRGSHRAARAYRSARNAITRNPMLFFGEIGEASPVPPVFPNAEVPCAPVSRHHRCCSDRKCPEPQTYLLTSITIVKCPLRTAGVPPALSGPYRGRPACHVPPRPHSQTRQAGRLRYGPGLFTCPASCCAGFYLSRAAYNCASIRSPSVNL
jgi:hypothetical protein